MSFVHGTVGRVYVNGFDLSAFLRQGSSAEAVEAHEVTTFGATAKAYFAGLTDATLTLEGLFSAALGATDAVLQAALRGRAPTVWNWLPAGDVDGGFGYGCSALHTSYDIESPVDGMVAVSAEAQSTTGLDRVQVLAPLLARSATGNGASRDHGAATTAGGVGYLQMPAISGAGASLVGRIQHSVDAVTWADLITFATETTPNRAQRIAVAGTVNRHTRATWTIAGTTPSVTCFLAFARF